MSKKERYVKIEQKGDVIQVQMENADEIDLLGIVIHLIADISIEIKETPDKILEGIKCAFDKRLVNQSERIYADDLKKENLN
jgi:hypothetical protein